VPVGPVRRAANAHSRAQNHSPLPPASDQYCRYIGEWIGTKLRWGPAVDKAELDALKTFADGPCEETVIDHQPAQ
jgi:hypothetical protein